MALGCRVLPPLYAAYMGWVWRTSRIEDRGLAGLHALLGRQGAAVGLVWHEEVIGAPWAYAWLGFRPHTLASRSHAGDLVTRLLQRCGFVVERRGSAAVWRRMIAQLAARRGVLYAIAVDGTRGPAYRLARGPLVLARESGAPLVLVRCWYARCLRLPTWDRCALPLPWNRIRYAMAGPHFVSRETRGRQALETERLRLERELRALAAESHEALGQRRPDGLRWGHETRPLARRPARRPVRPGAARGMPERHAGGSRDR